MQLMQGIQMNQCQILSYFKNRLNSGFVEGLNNRIKVIKRRCYGLFNTENLFQRISIDLARLPISLLIIKDFLVTRETKEPYHSVKSHFPHPALPVAHYH